MLDVARDLSAVAFLAALIDISGECQRPWHPQRTLPAQSDWYA